MCCLGSGQRAAHTSTYSHPMPICILFSSPLCWHLFCYLSSCKCTVFRAQNDECQLFLIKKHKSILKQTWLFAVYLHELAATFWEEVFSISTSSCHAWHYTELHDRFNHVKQTSYFSIHSHVLETHSMKLEKLNGDNSDVGRWVIRG